MSNTTRKIVISALLIAIDVLLTRVLAINTNIMKIGLGFIATAVGSALFGPLWGALIAALGDIVGSLLLPTGAYFPGFTITAAMTGLIYGVAFYNKKITWVRGTIAAAVNVLLVTYICNTALITYISGTPYAQLLKVRAIQLAVMFPLQAVMLSVVLPVIIKQIKKGNDAF